jgi:uncharacterized membrane protein
MAGMLQIITYLLAFYLIIKGFGFLQIALASNREKRVGIIVFAIFIIILCIIVAVVIVIMQDQQALFLSN